MTNQHRKLIDWIEIFGLKLCLALASAPSLAGTCADLAFSTQLTGNQANPVRTAPRPFSRNPNGLPEFLNHRPAQSHTALEFEPLSHGTWSARAWDFARDLFTSKFKPNPLFVQSIEINFDHLWREPRLVASLKEGDELRHVVGTLSPLPQTGDDRALYRVQQILRHNIGYNTHAQYVHDGLLEGETVTLWPSTSDEAPVSFNAVRAKNLYRLTIRLLPTAYAPDQTPIRVELYFPKDVKLQHRKRVYAEMVITTGSKKELHRIWMTPLHRELTELPSAG